ncbi:MAG: hypothetical protein Ct9H90mP22_7560 [Gammaproteobacteria bacterium]|nr:MAG: hypothetical protein Ct9H90mP22_7560 [Gammaproteobacteria bacterium]
MKNSKNILFVGVMPLDGYLVSADVLRKRHSIDKNFQSIEITKTDQYETEKDIKIPKPLSLANIDWNKDIFYDRSESYRKWFKLTGISKMRDGYKAFINNEIMSEGDRIRGFVVKKITEKKVVLKKNNSSVTLRL